MNLVSFALRRPISLLMVVVAVALLGFLALDRMSRDIFPDLGVPVLYVAQPYGGLDPPLRTHLPEWHHRLRPHQGIHRRPCQKQKPGCDHDSDVGGEPGQNPMQHGAHASLLSITRQVYHIS